MIWVVADLMKLKKQHHFIRDDREIIEDRMVINDNKGIHKEINED
jgi:hypothetical protein